MIQFNLLPDVKVEYIKAHRSRRLVTLVSIGLSALSLFVLLLSLVTVDVVQKKTLRDLDTDIKTTSGKLTSQPDLNKVLTVQHQLNTLTGLHDLKPVSSRLFTYLSQLTPDGVTISSLKSDYTLNTLSLTGAAPSLDQVNKYTDTLKATTYAAYKTDAAGQKQQADDDAYFKANGKYPTDSSAQTAKAFSGVVLTSFGKSSTGATYTIDLTFDAKIFQNTNNITLRVPTDTVSNTSVLFKKAEQ